MFSSARHEARWAHTGRMAWFDPSAIFSHERHQRPVRRRSPFAIPSMNVMWLANSSESITPANCEYRRTSENGNVKWWRDAMLRGTCLCGSVSVEVAGPFEHQPEACHCRMCRKQSGHVGAAVNVRATRSQLVVSNTSVGTDRPTKSNVDSVLSAARHCSGNPRLKTISSQRSQWVYSMTRPNCISLNTRLSG